MMRTVFPKQNRSSAASMNLPKHVLQTRKTIPAAGGGARVVRIFCTDADATDSSCSEEENATENFTHRRKRQMVRYVHEILFEPAASARRNSAPRPWAPSEGKRFRGVRQRRWGRYSAEIRDPSLRKRRWLGTFDTAEEAAAVYDLAAIQLKGDKAVTNFPTARAEPEPPAPAKLPDPGFSGGEPPRPLLSPTSVLRYGDDDSPFNDCIIYGDVDAFGFSVLEEHICLPESYLPVPATWMEELGYGEIDNLLPLEVSDL